MLQSEQLIALSLRMYPQQPTYVPPVQQPSQFAAQAVMMAAIKVGYQVERVCLYGVCFNDSCAKQCAQQFSCSCCNLSFSQAVAEQTSGRRVDLAIPQIQPFCVTGVCPHLRYCQLMHIPALLHQAKASHAQSLDQSQQQAFVLQNKFCRSPC